MTRRVLAVLTVVAAIVAGVVLATGGGTGAVAACTGADALDFDCQERHYVSLTQAEGAKDALHDLARTMEDGGYVAAACHQLAHRIGRTAGAADGIGAFDQGGPVCGSGYYHGVTEAAMIKLGPDASGVCGPLREEGPYSADYGNCIHGMGHGFMGIEHRDIEASLRGCDGLAVARERHGCYSGVFMENLSTVDHPDARTLRPKQPLYPCTDVAARYKSQCYDRQSTYALFVSNGDFATVFELCAETDRGFREACVRGLGGDAAAETASIAGRVDQVRARHGLCMLGKTTGARAACVSGAVPVILQDLDGGPAQLDAFCASFEVVATQPEHAVCLRASEKGYRALLAQQTGVAPAGVQADFVCHLKQPGARRQAH